MFGVSMEQRGSVVAKVLAVDDKPGNLLALAAVLDPLEVEVVAVATGADALRLAAQDEFAAILLDVLMPDLDGFETLAGLRMIPSALATPVILVTAHELDGRAIERVQGMGTVDYVLKPIEPVLLRSKVAALVSLFRRGKEIRRRDAALAAKDRDIAMLAHDLQTPLTTIEMSAQLLLSGDGDPGQLRSASDRIVRAAHRMSEMIRSLTDYARAGHGPFPIERSDMDLGEVCGELIADLRSSNPGRAIDLACSGDLRGKWDRERLYQAVSNLIGNALKYGVGTISVRAEDASSDARVSVHNDGPPIAADLLPLIFKPFERGTQDRQGLGLGLYIVQEIVKGHQGEISVTSSAGVGTTFLVRLPRLAPATPSSTAPPSGRRGPQPANVGGPASTGRARSASES
ncbi:MAG TPA: hybrid sensor histidine kinase/response regulator [Polyangia bacterium]|jgi:signal transduction histidine kinase|nr:hybrid sensor histidine kinase/response regulator [Polyangia bacterium]